MHQRRCHLEQLYHSFQEPLQISISHFSLRDLNLFFFKVPYFPCSFRNIKKTDAKSDHGRSSDKHPKSNKGGKSKKGKEAKEEEDDKEDKPAPKAPPSKTKKKEAAEPVEPEVPKKKRRVKQD